jgi:hypothetical protein
MLWSQKITIFFVPNDCSYGQLAKIQNFICLCDYGQIEKDF